jgi:hypothetical protein
MSGRTRSRTRRSQEVQRHARHEARSARRRVVPERLLSGLPMPRRWMQRQLASVPRLPPSTCGCRAPSTSVSTFKSCLFRKAAALPLASLRVRPAQLPETAGPRDNVAGLRLAGQILLKVSSRWPGSTGTPRSWKKSTWRASWASQSAFYRAPRTCGCRPRSNSAGVFSSCFSRTGLRSTEKSLFEPP